jgi:hypothetical protein
MASLPPFAWSTTLRNTEALLSFAQKTAEFLRAISKLKILDGQFLDVNFVAASAARVRHTLGRPYNGAIVVMTSDAAVTPAVHAVSSVTLGQQGVPVDEVIELGGTVSFTAKLTVWVF